MDVDKILLDFADTEEDLDLPGVSYLPGQADSLLRSITLGSAHAMKGTSGMKMQMNHPQSMLQMVPHLVNIHSHCSLIECNC